MENKIIYIIFWKNVDFPAYSEGPVLIHHHTTNYFTKKEARERCAKLNDKLGNVFTEKEARVRNKQFKTQQVKKGDLKVRHWVKEEII